VPRIHPFAGYVVDAGRAPEVVAPAYDSLSPAERIRYAASHPHNYLNAMKSLEDFDGDADIDDILAENRSNLDRLLAEGCFRRQRRPALFVYRLALDGHVQTGLVGELAVSDIERGAVLKHELTRVEREQLLVDYQMRVGASSSPVALAYPASERIRNLQRQVVAGATPRLDLASEDGVRQTLWRIDDATLADELVAAFAAVPVTYLTDGHHRVAAASRLLAQLRDDGRDPRAASVWDRLLVALFPHDELRVLPFHRCVSDLGGMTRECFLERLGQVAEIEALTADSANPPSPARAGEFTMVLDDACYRLRLESANGRMDVSLLQERVLEPVLGIGDSRADARLEYVSGVLGVDGVNRLRQSGWRVCFYCHPVSMEDVMRVSDAGGVMPPKSTSFEPKVRSGLFLRLGPTSA
jgi:uncharacterized protein (DUF1015 family)